MFRTLAILGLVACQSAAAQQSASMPETLPQDATRLEGEAITALMSKGPYTFVGASGKATGTSNWDPNTGTAFGVAVWDGKLRESWVVKWSVAGDQSCIETPSGATACTYVYAYRDGFLEVDLDGTIHTLSLPFRRASLPAPLSVADIATMVTELTAWGLHRRAEVEDVRENGVIVELTLKWPNGETSRLEVNAQSGLMVWKD